MAPPAPSCVLLRAGLRAHESAVGPRFDAFPGRNPVARDRTATRLPLRGQRRTCERRKRSRTGFPFQSPRGHAAKHLKQNVHITRCLSASQPGEATAVVPSAAWCGTDPASRIVCFQNRSSVSSRVGAFSPKANARGPRDPLALRVCREHSIGAVAPIEDAPTGGFRRWRRSGPSRPSRGRGRPGRRPRSRCPPRRRHRAPPAVLDPR